MSDVVDHASVVIEAAREDAVARVQAALAQAGEADCLGCGEAIEPERRAVLPSAVRCHHCQGEVEKRNRRPPATTLAGVIELMARR
ncbi:TraR/DksA C4-type zinc finger protein [Polymorphobacter sp.]|uniref:TraR/DksA C4-type zinc finger protein n=1 Tax=Polymorphobacter sp. TaxID=1909290 RepID=UPI003F6F172A